MADDDLSALFETFSGSSAPRQYTDADRETQWSDYGRALGVGAINIGKGAAALTDWATEGKAGRESYEYLDELAKEQMAKTSPAFQRAAGASFLPDSVDDVSAWDVGLGRTVGAKLTLAAPSLVASVIPGALAGRIASAVGASLRTSIGVGAGTAKAAGSAMNAGDVTSQIYDEVAKQPHEVLMRSPKYREYIAEGISEKDAKQRLMRDVVDVAPYVAAGITYMTGGVEGQIAGRLAGQGAEGIIKGAVKGFLGEAAQESLESGSGEFLSQEAQKNQYLINDYDWNKVLAQTIEGGVVGGLLGGATGGVSNIGGGSSTQAPPPPPAPATTTGNAGAPAAPSTPAAPAAPTVAPLATTATPAPPLRNQKLVFTIDTLRSRLSKKGIEFPENRLDELTQRIAGFANLATQGEKHRAVAALLDELYGSSAAGVQVVNGPVGATEAAALQTETQTPTAAIDPAKQVLAGKIDQAQALAGSRDRCCR